MSVLTARDAYRLWAPHYESETAVSHLENLVVGELGVSTQGRQLLDVGCGTGRRLRDAQAALAVGVDASLEMLAACRAEPQSSSSRAKSRDLHPTLSSRAKSRDLHPTSFAAADVLALPFASTTFDVVWCRLVIGHVRDMETAFAELSRVCRANGTVIVSDFCPEAVAAGHRRTFQDSHGTTLEVEHFVHTPEAQIASAAAMGLSLDVRRNGAVDTRIRQFFVDANRLSAYDAQLGLPLVFAQRFRKGGAA